MIQQGAASPSLAPRNACRGGFLGPFRNCCASAVPNLPVSSSGAGDNTNASVRIDTLDNRPPYMARTTSEAASGSFNFWIRGFPTGLSGRDPVLERSHSNTAAISLSAYGGWL